MLKYGAIEFFTEFRKNVQEDNIEDIDRILTLLISEESFTENESPNSTHSLSNSQMSNPLEDRFTLSKASIMEDTLNDRAFGTGSFGNGFPIQTPVPNTHHKESKKLADYKPKMTKVYDHPSITKFGLPKVEESKINAFDCLKDKSSGERTYIQLEKEKCELPYITLTESDENILMDLSVILQYSDARNFSSACRELDSHTLKDFPFETFLQRTDIVNTILDKLISTTDTVVFHN